MADALVVIDMQSGSFGPAHPLRHDLDGVVGRINRLARWVRGRGGVVVWIQHDGPPGDSLEPGTEGWRILPALEQDEADEAVSKTANDSFLGTRLEAFLRSRTVGRVIIAGWATDFCVDATVRASTARGFKTCAVSDGHTLSDRPHLPASKVIEHHSYIWADLIAPGGPAAVLSAEDLLSGA